jgi:hypothetical protein
MNLCIYNLNFKNNLAKYNLVGLKEKSLIFKDFENFNQKFNLIKFDFNREKKRPNLETLKNHLLKIIIYLILNIRLLFFGMFFVYISCNI